MKTDFSEMKILIQYLIKIICTNVFVCEVQINIFQHSRVPKIFFFGGGGQVQGRDYLMWVYRNGLNCPW